MIGDAAKTPDDFVHIRRSGTVADIPKATDLERFVGGDWIGKEPDRTAMTQAERVRKHREKKKAEAAAAMTDADYLNKLTLGVVCH